MRQVGSTFTDNLEQHDDAARLAGQGKSVSVSMTRGVIQGDENGVGRA